MERAGKTLSKLKVSGAISTPELVCSAWPEAVGKRLATRTRATLLVRDRLIVEVEDAIWQKQLFHLEKQILGRLCQVIGNDLVHQIEFRIALPRKPPHATAQVVASNDDADRIEDSTLRMVYKLARRKASA